MPIDSSGVVDDSAMTAWTTAGPTMLIPATLNIAFLSFDERDVGKREINRFLLEGLEGLVSDDLFLGVEVVCVITDIGVGFVVVRFG